MIRKTIALTILTCLTVALMSAIALRHAPMLARPIIARTTPLPAVTPTVTATPGWWNEADFATPTLPKLPGVKKPAFSDGVGGPEPGQPVSFTVISCPTAGVKITDIRTASGPWWHIYGVADIPNLWYWKAEASTDGEHWVVLYRSEQPASGLLVRLNLTTLPTGPRFLRLTAVDHTGNYPGPCVGRAGE
jgi:hypothetical protein